MRALLVLVALTLAASAGSASSEPTPVRGPSWLQRLGVELEDTHLGKLGGEERPPAGPREPMPDVEDERAESAPFTLGGHDLYRLSCESCHGPDGRGSPPEVNSVLDPVRATSAALLEARQRKAGRRLGPAMAKQLAAEAKKSLRDRIANGGKRMPPFPQLAGDEVDALVSYLETLAGLGAEARPPPKVTLAAAHAGELLVKGTCHICHPATGPGANPMMMYMRGVIPALASLPEQRSLEAVVAKVREGRSSMGGGMMQERGMMGGMMHRTGRMPVLGYLTQEEVAAAYLFLSRYPPQPE